MSGTGPDGTTRDDTAVDEVTLAGVPGLPGLYRQAAVLALERRIGRSRVPADLPPVRHRVDGITTDVAALARFQQLLGSAGRDRMPSAYLHTLAFPVAMSVLTRPDFPLPLLGMVHLSNEVHQSRQVGVAEPLDVVARAEALRPHAAGTQVDLVTEVRVGPERVWTGRSVYLARGVGPDTAGRGRQDGDRPAFSAPVPTGLWRLGADTGRRYARVSGDWNPIHLSGPTARVLGMRRAIAHGMYVAARMVDQAVPAPSGAMAWRIDFQAPVLLPGVVTTSFTRAPAAAEDDGGGLRNAHRIDVVGWDEKRRRPHFSGWVRAE